LHRVLGPDPFGLARLFLAALLRVHVRDDLRQELLRVIAERRTHIGGDRAERSGKRLEAVDDFAVMLSDELTE